VSTLCQQKIRIPCRMGRELPQLATLRTKFLALRISEQPQIRRATREIAVPIAGLSWKDSRAPRVAPD